MPSKISIFSQGQEINMVYIHLQYFVQGKAVLPKSSKLVTLQMFVSIKIITLLLHFEAWTVIRFNPSIQVSEENIHVHLMILDKKSTFLPWTIFPGCIANDK